MAYLFDTDALSELLRPRPAAEYLRWLGDIPREDQFVSAVSIGELYRGAFRSPARERHIENIEERILPSVTTIPFDLVTARMFGMIRADLERIGLPLDHADLQIAATALHHGLELVTGNIKHFSRVPGLTISTILATSR